MTVLTEGVEMLTFLFVTEKDFRIDAADAAKVHTVEAKPILEAAHEALADATQMLQYHGRDHACQAMRAAAARLREERNGFLERANQARGDT